MKEITTKQDGDLYPLVEMEGVDNDVVEVVKGNNELLFKPEFIPFYLGEVKKYGFSNTEGLVYGFVRFYLKNNPNGKFYFTNEQLAHMLGVSPSTISNSMSKICECGEFKVTYKIKANGGTFRLLENCESDYEKVKSQTMKKLRGNKNNINKNNINKYICDFNSFWSIYPKKVGKKKSEEIYKRKVVSKEIEDSVLEGVRKYVNKWKAEATDIKYIPNPATWLNQERWEDEVVVSNERFNRYSREREKQWEEVKRKERENYNNSFVDDGKGGMVRLGDFVKRFKVG